MNSPFFSRGHPGPRSRRAFTLVEVVVALTILTVIAAVMIPSLKGLDNDEAIREPVRKLEEIVQEARARAIKEQRPYQIVFEREGIHACEATYPFTKREDFLRHLDWMRTPPPAETQQRTEMVKTIVEHTGIANRQEDSAQPEKTEPAPYEPPWIVSIPLTQGTECEVLMWGDSEWDLMEGEKVRRWVFQPSGIASPSRVQIRSQGIEMEAEFDMLTGALIREKTRSSTDQS